MRALRMAIGLSLLLVLPGCDLGESKKITRRGQAQLSSCQFMRMVNDTLVFVESQFNQGGRFFNVADPDSPFQATVVTGRLSAGDAVFEDGIGYTTWSPWVRSIDVSDPAAPVTIDSLYVPLAALVSLSGDRLYAATADSLFVIDISRPDSLELVGQWPHLGDTFAPQKAVYSLAADGNRLFLSWRGYSDPQMELYNVTDPQAPVLLDAIRLVGTWETWGPPKSAKFTGDYIIYGNGYGLVSVRLDDNRTQMKLVDSLDMYKAYLGYRDSGNVYTANIDGVNLSGHYAVCAGNFMPAAAVVDVSNPRKLRYVLPHEGDTGAPHSVDDVAAGKDYFYVAIHQQWFSVYEMP